ncbi:GAF domain-containing sensor histidine kinase [Polaribacter sp. IC073]|uniref:GAF domain-containing sensor histidine kinase n=1 Tax=Polaribacter sp. IC073 TaxID=2508540 RepID=UPI0011BE93C3|nr:GAF domain-containing sensor histidine kinase [Polaribacter sp. IC073]TXD49145.1 GAF domain-containing sensor histidine kinase [Polaribacter sp. IC073]
MIPANLPPNEAERLNVLNSYNILDTLPEEDYDAITKIASGICNTPIGLVSIIDENRQWFKSHHGLDATETPRDLAFCAHSILQPDELFIINDATKDKRFHDNPLTTGKPNVVFYAGAPLNSSEGYPLGTLCVIDNQPKELSDTQKESLKLLAKQVVHLLELRKKNQELTTANSEVLRLNKQLSEFAYRLSHDLKTPISGIKYLSEVIQEDYADKLDTQGKSWLNLISSRSSYLYSLVEGMLNFTKTTNAEIVFETFHLEGLLAQIKSSSNWNNSYKISYSGCTISLKQSKIAFIQIFQNLLSNSIKFNDKAETVISISLEVESDYYRIIYKDNGPGIEEKYHNKVFGLFETLDSEKGTGIGLSTVSSMLERLGGSIDLKKTKEEEGVEFCLKFPIIKN